VRVLDEDVSICLFSRIPSLKKGRDLPQDRVFRKRKRALERYYERCCTEYFLVNACNDEAHKMVLPLLLLLLLKVRRIEP
jgi:hypothetical protein